MAVDQPLYTIGIRVQWEWPDHLGEDKYFLMLGGLHTEMAAFRAIGTLLDNSGWTMSLVDAGVTTQVKAESFLLCQHVTRTRHGHQVTAASLNILLQRAYKNYIEFAGATPLDLHTRRTQMETEHSQFKFWSFILEFELTILLYVTATREGDFGLYIVSLGQLVIVFHALGLTNYQIWLTVYLMNLLSLPSKLPALYTQFIQGNWVFKKTCHMFSAIALDQAHEQLNAHVKADGGALGILENNNNVALRRWSLFGPEATMLIEEYE